VTADLRKNLIAGNKRLIGHKVNDFAFINVAHTDLLDEGCETVYKVILEFAVFKYRSSVPGGAL
jgi:hypothetical protein